jgi:hypothetical protein
MSEQSVCVDNERFKQMVITNPLVIRVLLRIVPANPDERQFFPDGLLQSNIWIFSFYDGGGLESDRFVRINFRHFDPEPIPRDEKIDISFRSLSGGAHLFGDVGLLAAAFEVSVPAFAQMKPVVAYWQDGGGRQVELSESEPHLLQNLSRIETALTYEMIGNRHADLLGTVRDRLSVFLNQKNRFMEKANGLAVRTPRYAR